MRTACCESVDTGKAMRPALKGVSISSPWLLLLVPKFGCPLCWPLLAGLLGTLGLGIEALNQLSIVVAMVALAVTALRWRMLPGKRLETTWLCASCAVVLTYRLQGTAAAVEFLSLVLLMAAILFFFRARNRTRHNAGVCTIPTQ